MIKYTVKKLAQISGVSIRTLHHYDKIGLLKPTIRTQARYRMYGEAELLRLQQILFYKELDFALEEIAGLLDDPDFDMINALESHRSSLTAKAQRIAGLLSTIEKTILKLKGKIMLKDEELYDGLSKEKVEGYRKEIVSKYGVEALQQSENSLRQMSKSEFEELKVTAGKLYAELASHINEDPHSRQIQELISKHYAIIRTFWGTTGSPDPQWEAYKGLGSLYISEPSYTSVNGKPNPAFAQFMNQAMSFFVEKKLNIQE
jgi:DNA-binding transcriptional MerR regulator